MRLLAGHVLAVEQLCARELLAGQAGAVGNLLKDRVFNDETFTGAIRTVAAGGTVLDPEVVKKLLGKRTKTGRLSPRELQVLTLMAGAGPTPPSPSPSACTSPRRRSASTPRASSPSWIAAHPQTDALPRLDGFDVHRGCLSRRWREAAQSRDIL
ncbi:MAG TPA: hypothetical protein VGG16_09675 [Streptosporangiaceae bacterium]